MNTIHCILLLLHKWWMLKNLMLELEGVGMSENLCATASYSDNLSCMAELIQASFSLTTVGSHRSSRRRVPSLVFPTVRWTPSRRPTAYTMPTSRSWAREQISLRKEIENMYRSNLQLDSVWNKYKTIVFFYSDSTLSTLSSDRN